jgi:hypothetical protein
LCTACLLSSSRHGRLAKRRSVSIDMMGVSIVWLTLLQ